MLWLNEYFVILLHLAGLIVTLAVHASAIIRARRSQKISAYKMLSAMMAILLISKIIMGLDDSTLWLKFIQSLRILGSLGGSFSFFWFAILIKYDDRLRWKSTILTAAPAVISFITAVLMLYLGNQCIMIFGVNIMDQRYFMLPISIVSSVYVAAGLVFLLKSLKKTRQDRGKLLIIYLVATLVPLVFLSLKIVKPELFMFDPMPLTAAFASLLFAYSAMRLQLGDVMPFARRDIMNEMDSMLAIVRNDGMIIDCNEAFARVCGGERRYIIGKNIKDQIMPVMEQDNELSNLTLYKNLIDANTEVLREIELNTITGRRYFEVMVKPFFTSRNKLRGRLMRLTELSRERQLRQLLADQNKQLVAANYSLGKRTRIAADLKRMTVRNQLARELHDQLGHTIIMALSSIDRIDHESDKDNSKRWVLLEELMQSISELLQRSLPEKNIANDSYDHKQHSFGILAILKELQQEAVQAGIHVELDIQGPPMEIPTEHLHDLKQIFRETMTNAIKHGNADKIDYFIMITDNGYDVIIADNGSSVDSFEKGFGLKNIEQRVEGLGGTVRFQHEKSGFAVFIKILLNKKKSS